MTAPRPDGRHAGPEILARTPATDRVPAASSVIARSPVANGSACLTLGKLTQKTQEMQNVQVAQVDQQR